MYANFEQGECGADSISVESETRGSGEERVHDVVGVRSEANEEEEFGSLFDGAYNALDRRVIIEPSVDRVAQENTRE